MLFTIASRIGGVAPNPHKGLYNKDGVLLCDSDHIDQRWAEHYCEVLCVSIVESSGDTDLAPVRHQQRVFHPRQSSITCFRTCGG